MKYLKMAAAFAMLLLAACSNDAPVPPLVPDDGGKLAVAHGKVNQVLVVCDSALWEGPVGDSFFYYFGAPYLLLPEPEPIFDLKQISPEGLSKLPMDKASRTILFLADLDDENSTTARLLRADLGAGKIAEIKQGNGFNVTIGQDKWALSQQLFYMGGFGQRKLTQCISTNFAAIAQSINERDCQNIMAAAYKDGDEGELQDEVLEKFGLHLKLPKGFKQAGHDAKSNTVLLRKNDGDPDVVYDILLRKLPVQGKSQLTERGIKKAREETVKIAKQAGFKMLSVHADEGFPIFVELKPLNAAEAKGVWRDGHFTGPFISYLLLNHKTNEMVFVDGFVAVKMDGKRDPIQALELVLSSAGF